MLPRVCPDVVLARMLKQLLGCCPDKRRPGKAIKAGIKDLVLRSDCPDQPKQGPADGKERSYGEYAYNGCRDVAFADGLKDRSGITNQHGQEDTQTSCQNRCFRVSKANPIGQLIHRLKATVSRFPVSWPIYDRRISNQRAYRGVGISPRPQCPATLPQASGDSSAILCRQPASEQPRLRLSQQCAPVDPSPQLLPRRGFHLGTNEATGSSVFLRSHQASVPVPQPWGVPHHGGGRRLQGICRAGYRWCLPMMAPCFLPQRDTPNPEMISPWRRGGDSSARCYPTTARRKGLCPRTGSLLHGRCA